MTDRELRVGKIESGTVIDHVTAGRALQVLAVLGIDGGRDDVVSVAMNVPSDRLGHKDVVKIEGRELDQPELDVLSLIAPDATVNIVRGYAVVEKRRVCRPDVVAGVLACPTPSCISNDGEPIDPTFDVLADGVRCAYCGTFLSTPLADHVDA